MLPTIFTKRGRSTFTPSRYWSIDAENALIRMIIIVRILTANTNSTPAFESSVPGGFAGTDTLERNIFGECDRDPSFIRNLCLLYNKKSVTQVMAMISNLVRMVIGLPFRVVPNPHKIPTKTNTIKV